MTTNLLHLISGAYGVIAIVMIALTKDLFNISKAGENAAWYFYCILLCLYCTDTKNINSKPIKFSLLLSMSINAVLSALFSFWALFVPFSDFPFFIDFIPTLKLYWLLIVIPVFIIGPISGIILWNNTSMLQQDALPAIQKERKEDEIAALKARKDEIEKQLKELGGK